MLTVSKALSSGQAQKYHKLEFTSKSQSYYGQGDEVKGEWQGKLAASLGLKGNVAPLEFSRLAEGLNPQTEEPMVRHRVAMDYKIRMARRPRRLSTGRAGMRRSLLPSPFR